MQSRSATSSMRERAPSSADSMSARARASSSSVTGSRRQPIELLEVHALHGLGRGSPAGR